MSSGLPSNRDSSTTPSGHAARLPLRAAGADLARDVRHGIRGLARTPVFALAAVLSLGIGIGATTAVFSVVNALLLRPIPYKHADGLVILWNRSPGLNITEDWFSTAQYFDIRDGHGGFDELDPEFTSVE